MSTRSPAHPRTTPGAAGAVGAPALALGAASAFSALPGAFYHHVAQATGSTWSTVWLFAGHGLAGVVGLSLLAALARTGPRSRPDRAGRTERPDLPGRTGQPGLPRLQGLPGLPGLPGHAPGALTVLLLADACAGGLLVLAPPPGGFGLLLAGRLITGLLLGMITPLATRRLLGAPGGSAVAVAAIFGGVGVGSLSAGALAGLGLTRPAVLAVGVGLLLVTAGVVTRLERNDESTSHAAGVERNAADDGADRPRAGGSTRTAGQRSGTAANPRGVLLAFTANGVLALFTSTLPGVVAAHGSDSTLLAGATAGLVMLAAGGVRLGLGRLSARAVTVAGAVGAGAGIWLFTVGLHTSDGGVAALLGGGLLLGAAAGLGYEAALRTVDRPGSPTPTGITPDGITPDGITPDGITPDGIDPDSADVRLARTAAVQRGGQLGLVVPVLIYPLVVR